MKKLEMLTIAVYMIRIIKNLKGFFCRREIRLDFIYMHVRKKVGPVVGNYRA